MQQRDWLWLIPVALPAARLLSPRWRKRVVIGAFCLGGLAFVGEVAVAAPTASTGRR